MIEPLILPLSTAQRGMWVGQQIAPAGAIYKIAEGIELHGAIDCDLLREALQVVTQEMETLRLRIVQRSGLPLQMVRPVFDDGIARLDFSGAPDPRRAAIDWMHAELSAPFDFDTSPVWVSAVLKIADDAWFWYHRAHHIMLDGFSGGMVVQRVAELYAALRQHRPASPPVYLPLATLIENETAYRSSEQYGRDRAYWMERMANLPDPATLAQRDVPAAAGLLRSTAMLPQAVALRLRERVKGMNVSLPQMLIALVAAYYYRMSGAEDLVFGLPVTARASGVMRRCPGMVANAVPIRLAMSDAMTVDALFTQVSRRVRESLRHQRYRYEDLRRDLGLLNQGQQIARLGINIEPFDYELTFDGVRATPHNLSNAQIEDLTVFIYDRSDESGLRIDLDANPALYTEAELDAHRGRLCRLIDAVTRHPEIRLGDIDLLDDDEHRRLLHTWNDTADATSVEPVPALFARQALATPDAIAVLFDGHPQRSLTYRVLDARSQALAAHLAEQETGRGDIVAVALPRSELLPVALLGILRAGAAYLPLDPDGPPERLSLMLADAAPVCVLTLRVYARQFAEAEIACLFLDDLPPLEAEPRPARMPDAESTAYVLFTSGSTGRPKAVEVSHGNLSNFIEAMRGMLTPDASDRLLSVTTITFDIAGLEMFLPLISGARLVIAGNETIRDPMALGRLVTAHGITMLQGTPSLWRTLLANPDASLSAVHALVGGEALPSELAGRLIARTRRATNLYGPTETTIWSTAMELRCDDADPPPIGRPIRNTRAYVLDARSRPVPVGCAGRLHIGGAGVALGYLNQKALTDERFLADPFTPGGRLYDTGDLARWREDGVLEYLGRGDQQIKIRGYRIELREIEIHLARHESVSEAAVAVRSDPAGEPALVAYVVAAAGNAPVSRERLWRDLARYLPPYMMPQALVTLDALPQTPNGKLDRKALPLPPWERTERAPPSAPRTETERRLVAIWQRVLARDDIGVHDNFFDLGGDSLSLAELFPAIAATFSKEIPFGSLFRSATIAGLATLIEEEETLDVLETLLPLQAEGQKPPLFCIHPIIGLGWPYAALLRHLDAGRPLYAVQARGLVLPADEDSGRPESIEEMAAGYLAEIRRVQPNGPYHLLGWSLGGLVAHAMAAQLRREGEAVALLALLDSYPFVGKAHEEIEEALQVQLALTFLGLPQPAGTAALSTMTELADHLCAAYDLLSQPVVQAVLRTQGDMMERLGRVVRDNLALARRHRPVAIDVEAVFCHATERTAEQLGGLLDYRPEAWRSLVRRLSVHDVACTHQDILSSGSAARIGAILCETLQPAAIPSPRHSVTASALHRPDAIRTPGGVPGTAIGAAATG